MRKQIITIELELEEGQDPYEPHEGNPEGSNHLEDFFTDLGYEVMQISYGDGDYDD